MPAVGSAVWFPCCYSNAILQSSHTLFFGCSVTDLCCSSGWLHELRSRLVTCGIFVHGTLSGFFIASAMAWKEQCPWVFCSFHSLCKQSSTRTPAEKLDNPKRIPYFFQQTHDTKGAMIASKMCLQTFSVDISVRGPQCQTYFQ